MLHLKKAWRWLIYLLALLLIVTLITLLAIRFVLFPNIDYYKNDIAQYASNAVGQKLSIGNIVTGWDGVLPSITLKDVNVFDAEERIALHLAHVDTRVSWLSVPFLKLKLSRLQINQPQLTIRRKADGSYYLAGVPLAGENKPAFVNWLLNQREIVITNAQITWQDDLRQAPALMLNQLNFSLQNPVIKSIFGQHTFIFNALPSVGTAQKMHVTGRFVGNDVAKLNTWQGDVTADLKQADISAFKPWLDYPVAIQSGLGDLQLSLSFANNKVESVKTVIALSNLAVLAKNQSVPLIAKTLSGEVAWSDLNNTQTITLKKLSLTSNTDLTIKAASGYVSRNNNSAINNGKPWYKADLKLDQFNLAALKQLANYVTLQPNLRAQLDGIAPVGELQNIVLKFDGNIDNAADVNTTLNYQMNANFKQLGLSAYEKMPGFTNLSGSINANNNGGNVVMNTQKMMLHLKNILRWPVPVDALSGNISWMIKNNNIDLTIKELSLSNPHITGTVNAKYGFRGSKLGQIDLQGKFGKGNAKYALFYYPISLSKPTLHWLDTSILAGRVEDVNLVINGNLANFPFVNKQNQPDKKLGVFKVTAKLSDAILDYGTGWPIIEGLGLNMLFEGKRMELNADRGHLFGNKIISNKTTIAQLDADWPILKVISEVQGTTTEGLKFVNQSPVKLVTQGFTESLKTSGNGKLQLELNIPLEDLEAAKYKGAYQISNGTIFANPDIGLPELAKLNGVLNFTETSLFANNINTEIVGGPAKLSLKTGSDKVVLVNATGRINALGIKKLVTNKLTDKLQGNTDWTADISIKKPFADIHIRSSLVGMAIALPQPFNKVASQALDFSLHKKQQSSTSELIDIAVDNIASAKIIRTEQAGKFNIERGDVGINVAANIPSSAGLTLHGKLDYVDADQWLSLFNDATNNEASSKTTPIKINKADIAVQKLDVFNRRINNLKMLAESNANGLKMVIASNEITGDAQWINKDNGKIVARLKNLIVPKAANEKIASDTKKEIRKQSQEYPALDIEAENFEINGKKLGELSLVAFENGEDWVIQKLNITNSDSLLTVQGNWHNWTRNPNTNLVIGLSSTNIGKTIKRFGQPDAIKGGTAEMSGQINWAGSPHEFDASALNGTMTFLATKGQFLKVDPSVGRLLGLLSLQSLPRRLSLDFRDLFSDGFAFDKISATAKIDNGILRSNDFLMDGPAAEARIKGETNLKTETQNLKVKVRPHISDSLSLAAFAGGPIAGVAAFVAQKILKDPFNKIVQSEYVISGTWDKPIEVKSESDQAPSNKGSPLIQAR